MAKVKFIGVPGENHQTIKQFGYAFKLGEETEVTDKDHLSVFSQHPHFSVLGADVQDVEFKESQPAGKYGDTLSLTIPDIKELIQTYSDDELTEIMKEESEGKNRAGVISAIKALLEDRKEIQE